MVSKIWRKPKGDIAKVAVEERSSSPVQATRPRKKGPHQPPSPAATVYEPWGRPTGYIEVAGVQYRHSAIRRIFKGDPAFNGDGGAETLESAVLVPDPHNPHSPSGMAIAVYVKGQHVGYIPETDVRGWFPTLNEFAAQGINFSMATRTWGINRNGNVYAVVRLSPPDPTALTPSNGVPLEPHVVLPRGRKRQVTKEVEHMDVLTDYIDASGSNPVAVTLRKITDIRPRSAKDVVQVEIDGRRVGVLSDATSSAMLPLVEFVEARGKLPVVRAAVEGNALQCEVVFWSPIASELDQAWLDSLGPAAPVPVETLRGPDFMWDEDV